MSYDIEQDQTNRSMVISTVPLKFLVSPYKKEDTNIERTLRICQYLKAKIIIVYFSTRENRSNLT
nr:MAG TPA: hypothetical protein [Caudoviricetes sp.]